MIRSASLFQALGSELAVMAVEVSSCWGAFHLGSRKSRKTGSVPQLL